MNGRKNLNSDKTYLNTICFYTNIMQSRQLGLFSLTPKKVTDPLLLMRKILVNKQI